MTTSTTPLRVGLIGVNVDYGWGSRAHVPALDKLPELALTAVCTTRPETAAASAERFNVPLSFHDHKAMVVHPDVDLVAVAVKVPYHHELTMAALEAGKHVYTEWPLAATVEQAREMADTARSRGLHTKVGLQGRGTPTVLKLRQLVQEGYVGEVLSVSMSSASGGITARPADGTWRAAKEAGASAFTITFGHAVDALEFCVSPFAEVSARVGTRIATWDETDTGRTVPVTAIDTISVSGTLENGAIASAYVGSPPQHGTGFRLEITGRDGVLLATAAGGPNTNALRLQGARSSDDRLMDIDVGDGDVWTPDDVPSGAPFHVAQMYRRFGEQIAGGPAGLVPDFDEAVSLHQLLDAVERASETGQRQRARG
ncbi:MAG: Gfo/Idh/MocA family oxidoreductase [Chloroflexota bacterium]|nr:Gfo/Idh/MocA family oxidoreductase [Chloroflexota bacterium]